METNDNSIKMYTIEELLQNKQIVHSLIKASDFLEQLLADKEQGKEEQLWHANSLG